MKWSPLLFCSGLVLAGCQVMPDLSDTTNATMRFRVHYQTPTLGSPMVEVTTDTSTFADRCVYVNDPFAIAANVADSGGVRSIVISPTVPGDVVKVRDQPGSIIAIPSPAETTQTDGGTTVPNPGVIANDTFVRVGYSTVKSFDTVTLLVAYQFQGQTLVPMRATARNWGQTTGVSEVYNFYVQKAEPSDPSRQPGMACPVPMH